MGAGDIIVVNKNSFGRKANIFDGIDDYVLHDAHAVARVAAGDTVGTYTAWIYIDNLTGEKTILSIGDNNSATEFLLFRITGDKLKASLTHGGVEQWNVVETTASLTERTWTHVSVVQNGTRPTLYVNGEAVVMTDATSIDLTDWYNKVTACDKFAIGVKESNATHTNDFKGAIGEVKYFNIALSANEILRESRGETDPNTERATAIETARVFDISMENDGTTDSGSGADNGSLTGDAHYGGEVSAYSLAMKKNVTGHAAEVINSFPVADRILSIIKRGD